MLCLGLVEATPQGALQVEQTLSKTSMSVKSCQGAADKTTVTLTLKGAEPVKAVDLVMVLDRSSSEDLGSVMDAALRLMGSLNESNNDRLAVVSFADTARLDQALTSDFDALERAVGNLSSGRLTALGDAVYVALEELNKTKRADAVPGIVVFSDGGATTGLDPLAQADRARSLGLPVYFVGLTANVNRGFLSELAKRANGSFFASASDQSLIGVLKRFSRALVAEFITITQILPDALSYAGTPAGIQAPEVVPARNGTTALSWTIRALVSGQVWSTQFDIIALQVGTFDLNRSSQLSYLDAGGARVEQPLPNPSLQVGGTPVPVPQFEIVPEQPKANQVLQFFDRTSTTGGAISTWAWDFGDGATSKEQNPTHVYQDIGLYTVRLTVTDANACSVSAERSFRISEVIPGSVPQLPEGSPPTDTTTNPNAPQVGITLGAEPVRTGVAATFSITPAGQLASCAWDFGDGGTSDQCQTTHTYLQAGTFTLRVTVTFQEGLGSRTLSQPVTVARENIKPTADFIFMPFNPRVGRPVGFDSTASRDEDGSITSWSWDLGDGTSATTPNPIHEYARPGTYTVTLTVTDNEGAASEVLKKDLIVGLPLRAFSDLSALRQAPTVPAWMDFYLDGGVVTDEELEDAARRYANGSFVQSTQYRLTEDDLRALTDLHDLRVFTAQYRKPQDAEAAGYSKVHDYRPGVGATYAHLDLLNSDQPPQFDRVPALIYAPNDDGQPELAGVRFVAFQAENVKLFGISGWSSFTPPPPPGSPGGTLPPGGVPGTLYVLTVWIWKENPDGMFVPLNPALK